MRLLSAMVSKPDGQGVNTDALACRANGDAHGCWVVADGQGSEGSGRDVARQTVQTLLKIFAGNPAISPAILSGVFEWAQRDLLSLQASQVLDKSVRASAALFCTGGRSALWAHIGNVRVYAFRDGAVLAQTLDHSTAQGFVRAGEMLPEEIRCRPERRRLQRSLGSAGIPRPSILEERFILQPGDLFLLCTDGFWEHVTEVEMLLDWCKSGSVQQWLECMEERLLKASPQGHDCYSAIALLAVP